MSRSVKILLIIAGVLILAGLLVGGYFLSKSKSSSTYKSVSNKPNGWFSTGQDASLLLSGIDFNNTGGALLFNHQGGIASDGKHLLLADRNNNRILIWNSLPQGNTKPDLVLGQKDFITNNPGSGLDGLNWPVAVATDGTHIVAADTNNNRILIWNSFPGKNDQPADLAITNASGPGPISKQISINDLKRTIVWPWAVWTNGGKLVVTSTSTSSVLIWNSFPSQNDQPADIVLKAQDKFGTPRSIASDGNHLMIGDHNARANGNNLGNFFWKTFPTKDDQPYDFFITSAMGNNKQGESAPGEIFWGGAFTPEGKFITMGDSLDIWNAFPQNETDRPTVIVGNSGPTDNSAYRFMAGDGSGVAIADKTLYVSTTNGNKIVVYKNLPTAASQKPDFAIGSPDINTNTLDTNFIMSNPVPATDGKSLFVSSDFDKKLYVWKNLPDESNAHPDFVYSLTDAPWDNTLFGNTLALAGDRSVFIWNKLPLNGELPDISITDKIGNVQFQELEGVAMDSKYFYLSDWKAGKIYVWEGVPSANSNPKFTIDADNPGRLSSDGKYLAVTQTLSKTPGGSISIYAVDGLSPSAKPLAMLGGPNKFNLPQGALISQGHLFVGDTGNSRVLIWQNIEDAIAGKNADVILGAENLQDTNPEIGRNKLFWPGNLAFDGSFLWVGEFKFSERLLRFSVK